MQDCFALVAAEMLGGLQASAPDHPIEILSRLYGGCIDHARDERLLTNRAPPSRGHGWASTRDTCFPG
jgi:hypothetical protein